MTADGDKAEAVAGEAVTLTLSDEIDISRGDLIATPEARPEVSDQFRATLIWMADEVLLPGRPYLVKVGTKTVSAQVTDIRHKVDVNSFQELAARTLGLNEVGIVDLSLSEPVAFDPYADNRGTGAFIVIDRLSNLTVGAGMIERSLRRAGNIHWQALDVTKDLGPP